MNIMPLQFKITLKAHLYRYCGTRCSTNVIAIQQSSKSRERNLEITRHSLRVRLQIIRCKFAVSIFESNHIIRLNPWSQWAMNNTKPVAPNQDKKLSKFASLLTLSCLKWPNKDTNKNMKHHTFSKNCKFKAVTNQLYA